MQYEDFCKLVLPHSSINELYRLNRERAKRSRIVSLFDVEDEKLKKITDIAHSFTYIMNSKINNVILEMFKENKNIVLVENTDKNANNYGADFYILYKGERICVRLSSSVTSCNASQIAAQSYHIKEDIGSKTLIVYFNDKNDKNVNWAERNKKQHLKYLGASNSSMKIQCIFLVDLFSAFNMQKQYDQLILFFNRLKHEYVTLMGYQITECYTPQAVDKLLINTRNEILNLKNTIHLTNFSSFLKNRIYDSVSNNIEILFTSQSDFSRSLIASEWMFHNSIIESDIEKTGIVAGYFKGIEQYLTYILGKKCNGRKISNVRRYTIVIGDNNWEKQVTLGSIQYFLSLNENKDMFQDNTYLKNEFNNRLSYWSKFDRNGYFHKDNLYDTKTTQILRKDSLELYYMAVGIFS